MSETYVPDLARGVRWDDPAFSIAWPFTPSIISERDGALGSYGQETSL
jgi:dTDP-4-dehydrorhamnose 3,5-epimerase